MPLAIFAASKIRQLGFERVIEEVVRAGGDTDSNASIAGHLCGAMLGASSVPAHLVDAIPDAPDIRRVISPERAPPPVASLRRTAVSAHRSASVFSSSSPWPPCPNPSSSDDLPLPLLRPLSERSRQAPPPRRRDAARQYAGRSGDCLHLRCRPLARGIRPPRIGNPARRRMGGHNPKSRPAGRRDQFEDFLRQPASRSGLGANRRAEHLPVRRWWRSFVLRRSLRRQLAAVTREQHLDAHGRRLWLLDQLDNYLDRWLAFAALGVPMESLLRDDLFLMLRHGSALFTEEIDQLPPTAPERIAWQTFAQLLANFSGAPSTSSMHELRKSLSAVRVAHQHRSHIATSETANWT
ncbi:MAG: ADP-ribosylglycohydrolase family protein [Opitutaceae bacterium]|nr:ADP-ribosylglycohydrolase family protein [Opitutaceae bacterium]